MELSHKLSSTPRDSDLWKACMFCSEEKQMLLSTSSWQTASACCASPKKLHATGSWRQIPALCFQAFLQTILAPWNILVFPGIVTSDFSDFIPAAFSSVLPKGNAVFHTCSHKTSISINVVCIFPGLLAFISSAIEVLRWRAVPSQQKMTWASQDSSCFSVTHVPHSLLDFSTPQVIIYICWILDCMSCLNYLELPEVIRALHLSV